MDINLKIIGIINSPYKIKDNSPRQGRYCDKTSIITVFDEFIDGLEGLDNYKFFIILYWQDRAERDKLKVSPVEIQKKEEFSQQELQYALILLVFV